MKLLNKRQVVDFARNKAMLSDGEITTNQDKYTMLLHKAIGIDNGGVRKTLEILSEEKDDCKIVESLRMIVEYYDLKEYMKNDIR